MTISRNFRAVTVLGLGLAGLLSIGLSGMGFLILGIGEACCSTNGPGGLAYLLFAASLTGSIVVVIVYVFWSPPKPLLVWFWAAAIVTALEVMTFQIYDPAKNEQHNKMLVFLGEWSIPQVWVPMVVALLCQMEAMYGPRRLSSSIE